MVAAFRLCWGEYSIKENDLPEEEVMEEAEEEQQPRNKTELYKMFNKKGPTVMISGFMSDPQLKAIARILVDVSAPLEHAFYKTLERLSQGWNEQCAWVSERALGSYMNTVLDILATLESEQLHDRLGFMQCLDVEAPPQEFPKWAIQEFQTLMMAYGFAFSLAEHVLWSQIQYWYSMPQLIACLVHSEDSERDKGLAQARLLTKALQKAENVKRPSSGLQDLLQDLAWQKQQLARESMALLVQGKMHELKGLAKRLYTGSSSTKDTLENCFAFLHRKAAGHVNAKMSDSTKYCYSFVSPYAESGGSPQILPEKDDYMSLRGPSGIAARLWAHQHLFSPQRTLFPSPKAVHEPKKIFMSKFRTAGPLSQQRSAAAAAFMIEDAENDFKSIHLAWVGNSSYHFVTF